MRAPIAIAAAATVAFVSSVLAGQNPRTAEEVERVFESIDRNNDDRISRREGQRAEAVRERFDGVDADQDGYLSRAEYRARPSDEQFE